jgi:peptidylprolyl isomerase/FKBP-type peptidyl-prolyl cis-trans isomerase FklB
MNKVKYIFLYLLIFSTGLLFTSCSDDDDDDGDTWRVENELFFNSLDERSDLYQIEAESGRGAVYYKVLKSGDPAGKSPIYTSTVNVYYTGVTLSGFDVAGDSIIAGKQFDTSYNDRNYISPGVYRPSSFQLSGLIEGWWVTLQEMKPGDKWQVYIPWELGYKESGSGSSIPGYSTLIFEVELVSVGTY